MATPSSSTTTPSPQLRYLQPTTPVPSPSIASTATAETEQEERDKAVQKFLARAEISKLTRGLRTRLSYASFKASHNVSHTTLPDLEAQTENQSLSPRVAANRSTNHYNNPATQGNSAMTSSSPARTNTRKGSMAPPPPVTTSASQSLFASILAPPPAKRARTIHNPQDPPLSAPIKHTGLVPTPRKTSKPSRASNESASKPKHAKDRSAKRKEKASDKGKGKGRGTQNVPEQQDDIDIQAAATLTSLLLSSRAPISASSPRSSLSAASDASSTHSYAHFVQSSTRTTNAATSGLSSAGSSFSMPRTSTPPLGGNIGDQRHSSAASGNMYHKGSTTPKAQIRPAHHSGTPHPPNDEEAAGLMLFLATSPSPVRPTTTRDKDAKDMAAFRALGGSAGLKGRVLFPGSGGEEARPGGRMLRREATGTFTSTSSVATELASDAERIEDSMRDVRIATPPRPPLRTLPMGQHDTNNKDVPMEPTVIPPTPTENAPTQLLPPPPSPARAGHSNPRLLSRAPPSSFSSSSSSLTSESTQAPRTPGNGSFNIGEFINVSPSSAAHGTQMKLNNSLRADVGRRLFEEHHGLHSSSGRSEGGGARSSSLGAGIDLVKS